MKGSQSDDDPNSESLGTEDDGDLLLPVVDVDQLLAACLQFGLVLLCVCVCVCVCVFVFDQLLATSPTLVGRERKPT